MPRSHTSQREKLGYWELGWGRPPPAHLKLQGTTHKLKSVLELARQTALQSTAVQLYSYKLQLQHTAVMYKHDLQLYAAILEEQSSRAHFIGRGVRPRGEW